MIDTTTTVAGVHLPFCAMNMAGSWASARELSALLMSASGAVMLPTVTVHPFVHPQFRSLHNPGYDKLALLARQLVDDGTKPIGASVCGAQADEIVFLTQAFADVGVAFVEVNLAEPWIDATFAPFDDPTVLANAMATIATNAPVGLLVRLPDRLPLPNVVVADAMRTAGIRTITIKNDFAAFEKFQLEAGPGLEYVVRGGIHSGWDVQRAMGKGAVAVQVDQSTGREPAVFERLANELRRAREQV